MAQSLLDGNWDLMPGVPHPRNLTGCDYLTSFEVKALLNTDLCSADEYSSIRFMCPVSCGCSLGHIYSVSSDGSQFEVELVDYFQVSNRIEDMGSCPAECVMVHPDISSDSSYDVFELGNCADTDNNVLDSLWDGCARYTASPWFCANY